MVPSETGDDEGLEIWNDAVTFSSGTTVPPLKLKLVLRYTAGCTPNPAIFLTNVL